MFDSRRVCGLSLWSLASKAPANAVSHMLQVLQLGWKDPGVIFVWQEIRSIFLRPLSRETTKVLV